MDTLIHGKRAGVFEMCFASVGTGGEGDKLELLGDATACAYEHDRATRTTTVSVTLLLPPPRPYGEPQVQGEAVRLAAMAREDRCVVLSLQQGGTGKRLTVRGPIRFVRGECHACDALRESYAVTGFSADWA